MTAEGQAQPGSTDSGGSSFDPVALAKALLAQSALRQKLFDGFLRERSWDILLRLYVAMHERVELTQEALGATLGEPLAAAELTRMEQVGLVACRGGCCTARQAAVTITDEAAAAVEGLLRDLAAGIHLGDCGLDRRH